MKTGILVLMISVAMISGAHAGSRNGSRKPSSPSPVCENEAKNVAKALFNLDFPENPIVDITDVDTTKKSGDTHSYAVAVNTGRKFDAMYQVTVSQNGAGPDACYLVSVITPQN